jgi:hypothetical protein
MPSGTARAQFISPFSVLSPSGRREASIPSPIILISNVHKVQSISVGLDLEGYTRGIIRHNVAYSMKE